MSCADGNDGVAAGSDANADANAECNADGENAAPALTPGRQELDGDGGRGCHPMAPPRPR
ncbi:MAG: hypothetical protein ACRDY1_11605 [Acidimicrobiales bacterium]